MKNLIKITAVAGLLVFSSIQANSQVVVKIKPARPKVVVVKPAKAKKRHVWVDGHWKWNKRKGKYVWVKGHWKKRKKGRRWVPGRWKAKPGGHVWIPGHWKRV